MRIYSISRLLMVPLLVIVFILIYKMFTDSFDNFFVLLVPIVLLAGLYYFGSELDYWYIQRNPLLLDKEEREMLVKYVPYYNRLDTQNKQKFENRISQYVYARNWKNIGASEKRDLPADVKILLAAQPIQLTFNDTDLLIGDYDRIYTYKHPFPSPKKQYLHTLEVDNEDGLILLALDYSLLGLTNPSQYYNIAMHAFAKAYLSIRKMLNSKLENMNFTWMEVEKILKFTESEIVDVIGFKVSDLRPILIMCYFTFPLQTKNIVPEICEELDHHFGIQF